MTLKPLEYRKIYRRTSEDELTMFHKDYSGALILSLSSYSPFNLVK
jgi:hypothetical protein